MAEAGFGAFSGQPDGGGDGAVSEGLAESDGGGKENGHRAQQRPALARVTDHHPEHADERHRYQQHGHDFDDVR
jgi:hypothetical protein